MRDILRITALLPLLLAACATQQPSRHPPSDYARIGFDAISGWKTGNQQAALSAFTQSCGAFFKKPDAAPIGHGPLTAPASAWKSACKQASTASDARAFFERNFAPYRPLKPAFLTGYYVPEIKGSLTRTARYKVPIYARPPELVNGTPYLTRHQIEKGALNGRALEVAYAENAVDLFFMQVQGSGTLITDKGERIGLAFAGKNNQPYVSIGKVAGERNLIPKPDINLFTLRAWLKAHPAQAPEIMRQNPSYVFFKTAPASTATGASGAALTPRASLAVDPAFVSYGLPVFVSVSQPNARFSQLMVAQDTGSAIQGALRGDIFFGEGAQAEQDAGQMKYNGEWVVLLPKETERHAGLR